MEYHPLSVKDNEIRVLTILTGNDDSVDVESPIRCTLQHVSLDKKYQADARKDAGSAELAERVWPEAYVTADMKPLWDLRYPDSSTSGSGEATQISANSGLGRYRDCSLPWRFAWGDYLALSYCWGDTRITREIIVNGHSIHVTVNLEAALRQLRNCHCIKHGYKIWADAICIDQNNLEERGQQVSRMRDVYSSAWHVVIWLGADADDSPLAMTAVKHLSARMAMGNPLSGLYRTSRSIDARPLFVIWSTYKSSLRKEVYRALYHLLTRPYWRRLWILQEVALGVQGSPVLCGSHSVLWGDMYNASCFMELDENRFGRDIMNSGKPRKLAAWSWEFARERVPYYGRLETSSEFLWRLPLLLTAVQQDEHKSNTGPLDATRVFHLSLGAKVTDQKDRVYGILGIGDISSLAKIKPDYHLSLQEVYTDFSKNLLARGDLDTLRLVYSSVAEINRGRTPDTVPHALTHPIIEPIATYMYTKGKSRIVASDCTHDLSSWVVCWACPRGPTAQLLGRYHVAAGEPKSNVVFEGDNILKTNGVLFDNVISLSSFHATESNSKFPFNGKPGPSFYGDITATKEALWRTLVGDATRDGAWAPQSYSLLLKAEIWEDGVAGVQFNNFGLHNFMARNAKLSVFEHTLKELVFGTSRPFSNRHRRLYNPSEIVREALSWATNVMAWRRLITTEKGYLGLAIAATEPDDRICILVGCKTPLVLRPRGAYFQVIGECYIHGIMRGEIAKDIREGRLRMDEIALC